MAQLTDLNKVRRRREKRRMIRGVVTLLIFAAVVFLCAVVIQRVGDLDLKTAYSDIKAGISTGTGFPVELPDGEIRNLGAMTDSIVLLSDTNIYTYNASGKQMMNEQHGLASQSMVLSGNRMLLYDRGGTKYCLASRSSVVQQGTTDFEILTADYADNGTYALVTGCDEAMTQVFVFNKNDERIFRMTASDPIISVALSDSKNEMATARVEVSNGRFLSEIRKYQFNYAESDVGRYQISGELLLSIGYQGNNLHAITDRSVRLLNDDLKELASFSFDGQRLDRFEESADGKLVLLLGNYEESRRMTVVVLDQNFQQLGRFTISDNISQMKIGTGYLYMTVKDEIRVYDFSGRLLKQQEVSNLSRIQPIGDTLYTVTNAAIDVINVKELLAPEKDETGSNTSSAPTSSETVASEPKESSVDASREESVSSEQGENNSASGQVSSVSEVISQPEPESEPEPVSSLPVLSAPPGEDLLNYDALEPTDD